MKKLASLLLIILLASSLTQCGQKGALTRPEQTSFAAVSK
jgi:predicted small lipoprotein YifL